MNQTEQPEGRVILIDKPLEWTSFDVVKKLRYKLKVKKIGHAGTLDPLATGLLILCTGKKTKTIDQIQAQEKEYTGTFILGQTTPSFDLETEPSDQADISQITEAIVHEATNKFVGMIEQIPPKFSAVKVDGKRAYLHARAGKEVKINPRTVEIKEFEITRIELPQVDFRVVCSKGTYIRALANDFGQYLKVGAYLAALRRTRIGEYRVEQADTIESVE